MMPWSIAAEVLLIPVGVFAGLIVLTMVASRRLGLTLSRYFVTGSALCVACYLYIGVFHTVRSSTGGMNGTRSGVQLTRSFRGCLCGWLVRDELKFHALSKRPDGSLIYPLRELSLTTEEALAALKEIRGDFESTIGFPEGNLATPAIRAFERPPHRNPAWRVNWDLLIVDLLVPTALWALTVASMVALRSLRARLAIAGRRRAGCCVSCGYDLRGNESGVCPECGTAITGQPSAT